MDAKLCDDHHICRNGGQCVPLPNYSGKYTCDCTLNGSDIIYAGLSCDHEATSYCNEDNIPDAVSFCTNGGKCRGNTDESGDHFGCDCPNGYKGNHCELTEGQSVPDFMTASSIRSNRNSSSSDNGNKTLVATLSATMAFLAAVALIAVFVVVKRRRNGMIHSIASPRSIREADSTQLDADGEVLKDSFRATTSGELYSPGSNVSQISKRKTLDPAVDMTEEVEFGEEEGHV